MDRISKNAKIIKATIENVYNAFTKRKALEFWLAPNEMTGKIHDFDLKVGGGYDMSLFYTDNKIAGKTSGNEDRFLAKFIELKPYEKIIQTIKFQSDQSKFKGEMIMEVYFDEIENNITQVTIIFKNIPVGVSVRDNEMGTEQSLEKLTHYIEEKHFNG